MSDIRITVGDCEFGIDMRFYKKLVLMCKRVTQKSPALDACLENEGLEGSGKTSASYIEAAIIKQLTSRPISLFFKTSSCIKFARETENQIIILDEPAIESLSNDANTTIGKDFLRLTTTMRKKRHFLILNFTKFWKFPEFLVVDRALGMVHLYNKDERIIGKFSYIKKNKLEALWNAYKKEGIRKYHKLKSFNGFFPHVGEKIFNDLDISIEGHPHCVLSDYDKYKDEAIAGIGDNTKDKKKDKNLEKLDDLRYQIAMLTKTGKINQVELATHLKINGARLREWMHLRDTYEKDMEVKAKAKEEEEEDNKLAEEREAREKQLEKERENKRINKPKDEDDDIPEDSEEDEEPDEENGLEEWEKEFVNDEEARKETQVAMEITQAPRVRSLTRDLEA